MGLMVYSSCSVLYVGFPERNGVCTILRSGHVITLYSLCFRSGSSYILLAGAWALDDAYRIMRALDLGADSRLGFCYLITYSTMLLDCHSSGCGSAWLLALFIHFSCMDVSVIGLHLLMDTGYFHNSVCTFSFRYWIFVSVWGTWLC